MTYSQQRSTNYITRKIAEVTDFFFLVTNYRICELYLHTEYHGGSRIFLVTRLVLGPTDRREVIFEFANYSLHTEGRGESRKSLSCPKSFLWPRICETCHWSRIIEFANFYLP